MAKSRPRRRQQLAEKSSFSVLQQRLRRQGFPRWKGGFDRGYTSGGISDTGPAESCGTRKGPSVPGTEVGRGPGCGTKGRCCTCLSIRLRGGREASTRELDYCLCGSRGRFLLDQTARVSDVHGPLGADQSRDPTLLPARLVASATVHEFVVFFLSYVPNTPPTPRRSRNSTKALLLATLTGVIRPEWSARRQHKSRNVRGRTSLSRPLLWKIRPGQCGWHSP